MMIISTQLLVTNPVIVKSLLANELCYGVLKSVISWEKS